MNYPSNCKGWPFTTDIFHIYSVLHKRSAMTCHSDPLEPLRPQDADIIILSASEIAIRCLAVRRPIPARTGVVEGATEVGGPGHRIRGNPINQGSQLSMPFIYALVF